MTVEFTMPYFSEIVTFACESCTVTVSFISITFVVAFCIFAFAVYGIDTLLEDGSMVGHFLVG